MNVFSEEVESSVLNKVSVQMLPNLNKDNLYIETLRLFSNRLLSNVSFLKYLVGMKKSALRFCLETDIAEKIAPSLHQFFQCQCQSFLS